MKLNFLILFIVLYNSLNANSESNTFSEINKNNIANALIHQLFEMLRTSLRNGSPESNVPVMDPLEFGGEIHFPGKIFNIKAKFTKGTAVGLADFKLLQSNFTTNKLLIDLRVNFPLLTLKAEHYDMAGTVMNVFPIEGSGKFFCVIHNLEFSSETYIKQSLDGKSLLIDKFVHPRFTMEKIVSETEFDQNIDAILNTMVEDLLADYISKISKLIASVNNNNIIVRRLNEYLSLFESWRVIALIL